MVLAPSQSGGQSTESADQVVLTDTGPTTGSDAPSELEEQLGQLRTSVRSDLKITRQLQRGNPTYLIHDPTTFSTLSLDADDYLILGAITPQKSLKEICDGLIQSDRLDESQRDTFYQFVLSLRKMNVLGHQGGRAGELYQQHQNRMGNRGGLMSWLMPKLPLANPDQFLERTLPAFGWLFGGWCIAFWSVLMAFAGYIMFARWDMVADGISTTLAAQNIPFVWGSFILMKVWHELGHGYACKRFGGSVPEMGTLFMMGTPLAYVDASAAWSFEKRRHRLAVMLGGMYFESFVGIAAVLVLAASTDPLVLSCAAQLIFMASVTTVLFNANPLMRYDGYFILCQLVQIQNLRSEATQALKRVVKRICFGITDNSGREDSFRIRSFLLVFAIASLAYTTLLSFAIAAMIAQWIPVVGIAVAVAYVISSYLPKFKAYWNYLAKSKEMQNARIRGLAIGVISLVVLPITVPLLPTPMNMKTRGVVGSQTEMVYRIDTPGQLISCDVSPGQQVQRGDILGVLSNPTVSNSYALNLSKLNLAKIKRDAGIETDQHLVSAVTEDVHQSLKRVQHSRSELDGLTILAKSSGTIVSTPLADREGEFIARGAAFAKQVDGDLTIQVYLTPEELMHAVATPGQTVAFSLMGHSDRRYQGKITEVSVVSTDEFTDLALSQMAGGRIVVDPKTGESQQKLYAITIDASEIEDQTKYQQGRVWVMIQRRYEPIGLFAYRQLSDFLTKLSLN